MTDRLQQVLAELRDCENQFQRKANSVALLAVSKAQSAEKVRQLFNAGQFAFGENYLQEALEKISALKDCDIEWHFIGRIQSNKTKAIAQNFAWVQSVANLKIAQRLNEQRPSYLMPLNICIQVNIDQDPNKDGVLPEELLSLAEQIAPLERLHLRGIMVIPREESSFENQLVVFEKANQLFSQLPRHGFICDTLSMGMSADFKAAIQAGSSMVRIGTALFGSR